MVSRRSRVLRWWSARKYRYRSFEPLASYIARSAQRSRSVGSVASSGKTAMPMLASTGSSRPATGNGRRMPAPQALGDHPGEVGVRAVEDDRELVAADPREQVVRAQGDLQARRDERQQLVAVVMAERVVDVLEVVEVDDEQRQRAVGLAVAQRALEALVERPAVGDAGQLVGARLAPRPRPSPGRRGTSGPCGRARRRGPRWRGAPRRTARRRPTRATSTPMHVSANSGGQDEAGEPAGGARRPPPAPATTRASAMSAVGDQRQRGERRARAGTCRRSTW